MSETLHLPLYDATSRAAGEVTRAACSCGWSSPWYPVRDHRIVDLEAAVHQSEATGRPMPRVNGAIAAVVWLAVLVVVLVVVAAVLVVIR